MKMDSFHNENEMSSAGRRPQNEYYTMSRIHFRRKSFSFRQWKWVSWSAKWKLRATTKSFASGLQRIGHLPLGKSFWTMGNWFCTTTMEMRKWILFISQWKWNESCRPGTPKWKSENESGFIAEMKMNYWMRSSKVIVAGRKMTLWWSEMKICASAKAGIGGR